MEPVVPGDLMYIVFTVDRGDWISRWEAYRHLSWMFRCWKKRMERAAELAGAEPIGNRWVAVVEQHADGWPHMNVLLCSRFLVQERERFWGSAKYWSEEEERLTQGSLREHAEAVGFGTRSTAEVVRSKDAVAGYLMKLAARNEGWDSRRATTKRITGEVLKLSQLPMAAPRGFRRLRSGIRFLPKKKSSGQYTGVLLTKKGKLLTRKKPGRSNMIALSIISATGGVGVSEKTVRFAIMGAKPATWAVDVSDAAPGELPIVTLFPPNKIRSNIGDRSGAAVRRYTLKTRGPP